MNAMDDSEAKRLLGPLAGEPGGAQRLDVDEIVRVGTRRRHARIIGNSVLAAVATVALAGGATVAIRNASLPQPGDIWPSASASFAAPDGPSLPEAPAGPDCTRSRLPGPAGAVSAVDHTGRYVVEDRTGKAVVWRDGEKVAEVAVPADINARYAINGKGEFVATLDNGAYAYRNGKLTRLWTGSAAAIADDGDIVGLRDGVGPVLRTAGATTTPPLPAHGIPVGIDDDGTIAGSIGFPGQVPDELVVWAPDGGSRPLPIAPGANDRYTVGIRNGWVAGANGRDGFRYNVTTAEYELLPAQFYRPIAVAADGSVLADYTVKHSYLILSGGTARKLQTGSATSDFEPIAISDDGTTVTGNEYVRGADRPVAETRAVRWTCD
ncbi:hypothetical protein [Actinoplanes sp. RD1]|uniref:hypothetical protein n=1 Tax=Actinoplanes sp. RD1 TaxID=3064538 RepID=UPI002740C0DF|nr:hypothetical protein [Actinoplanes sp. RD1]